MTCLTLTIIYYDTLYKNYFKDYDPRITEWDEPREREFNGVTS